MSPALAPGTPVPTGPVQLARDGRCVVDGRGVRFVAFGPATVAFEAEPVRALLVGAGAFSLERSGSAPRDSVATLATAAGVVRASGPVRLAGRVRAGELIVEVVSGSLRVVSPDAGRLGPGQRLHLATGGAQRLSPRGGTLEELVAGLRAAPVPASPGSRSGGLSAALERDLAAFEGVASPGPVEGEGTLARRRRLAAAAAARMQARAALEASLLRQLAAGLSEGSDSGRELEARARGALRRGR